MREEVHARIELRVAQKLRTRRKTGEKMNDSRNIDDGAKNKNE